MPLKTSLFSRVAGRLRWMVGGVQPIVAGGSSKWHTWPAVNSLTGGTDTTPVSGTRFTCEIFVPYNMIMTGIGYLIGSVGGTDKAIVELHDADGKLLANSDVAGVTVGTLATYQEIPFTAPVEVIGPQKYYLSVTMNGGTARLRTVPTAVGAAQMLTAKSATGTFGTVGDLTVPTTFRADKAPIAYTY